MNLFEQDWLDVCTPYALRPTLTLCVCLVAVAAWGQTLETRAQVDVPDAIELDADDFAKMPKLGVVRWSVDEPVELRFPKLFLGAETTGRIMLVNDSELDAEVGMVKTSCGCTSAIPLKRMIPAGSHNFLILHYVPKATGQFQVNADFSFGGKAIQCRGMAMTKPRVSTTTHSLIFAADGTAEIRIQKHTPTPLERLIVHPAGLRIEKFVDGAEFATAKLLRDPDRLLTEALVTPESSQMAFPQMQYLLQYPGVVNALPRRVFAKGTTVKFFLRGDVKPLIGATTLSIQFDSAKSESKSQLACEVKAMGSAASVSFEHELVTGDYPVTILIHQTSFPLQLSVR